MIGQSQLECVDNIKDLGVTFDGKLKFTDHANDKINKVYGMLEITVLNEISVQCHGIV